MEIASLYAYRVRPDHFFNWFHPLAAQTNKARPNPAYLALARLEKSGKMGAVITQNIDLLHCKAGSNNVIVVHGSLKTFSCINCYHKHDRQSLLFSFIENGNIPLVPITAQ
jgi:NAD-dependent deacetylase